MNELFGPEQQVYVVLDNCRAHPPQPMDMGIITPELFKSVMKMSQITFYVTDKCRYNQLITELSDMISNYMNITKTVNVSKSTNVHALNNPSNEGTNVYVPNEPSTSKNLKTEAMNVTHFRPLTKSQTKSNWKRLKEEVDDSDSDSSVVPEKLTSDHSSDNIVSDNDDDSLGEEISIDLSILPAVENDFIDD